MRRTGSGNAVAGTASEPGACGNVKVEIDASNRYIRGDAQLVHAEATTKR